MSDCIPFRNIAKTIVVTTMMLVAAAYGAPDRYQTQVMADSPFGYWRLGETAGTSAADSSGHGNTGTYSGGVTLGQPGLPPGVPGDTAVLFNGIDGRVAVPNSSTLNPSNITMEAKIRWDGRNDFQQRILEKSFFIDPGQEQAQYGLSIFNDRVRVELRTGAAGADPVCGTPNNVVCANSVGAVLTGVETHIAATYDGREVRIYINGVLDSVTAAVAAGPIEPVPPDPKHVPNDALGIGNQSVRNRPFKGLIDEVALFDRALTAEQIRNHYQSQFEEPKSFEYAVKFVCGKSDGGVVAPGTYFTAINVHNPNDRGIAFRKKFAVAFPGEKPGPISRFYDAKLGPDQAFEIDCPDILRKAQAKEPFLKGFAVIQTGLELDIVAVYTAAGATGRVETMELERVAPRIVRGTGKPGKPDLIPLPDPKLGFCRHQGSKLLVTVKNQGSGDAAASTTTVDFGASGSASQATPPIPAGGSADVLFDVPPGCFHPDCSFKITVDSNAQVDESIETNNSANGGCVG
jgi:hypothetical protein